MKNFKWYCGHTEEYEGQWLLTQCNYFEKLAEVYCDSHMRDELITLREEKKMTEFGVYAGIVAIETLSEMLDEIERRDKEIYLANFYYPVFYKIMGEFEFIGEARGIKNKVLELAASTTIDGMYAIENARKWWGYAQAKYEAKCYKDMLMDIRYYMT